MGVGQRLSGEVKEKRLVVDEALVGAWLIA
jgi:hypothetical protein